MLVTVRVIFRFGPMYVLVRLNCACSDSMCFGTMLVIFRFMLRFASIVLVLSRYMFWFGCIFRFASIVLLPVRLIFRFGSIHVSFQFTFRSRQLSWIRFDVCSSSVRCTFRSASIILVQVQFLFRFASTMVVPFRCVVRFASIMLVAVRYMFRFESCVDLHL